MLSGTTSLSHFFGYVGLFLTLVLVLRVTVTVSGRRELTALLHAGGP